MTAMESKDFIQGAPLTPAAKTGEAGMLSLEKSVMTGSEELTAVHADDLAALNTAIRTEVGDISGGTTQDASNYLRALLDGRLRIAASKVDEQLASMQPGASREDLNRLARGEVESALGDARAQERQLYESLPQNAGVGTGETTRRYYRFKRDLSKAERADMPQSANRFLDEESKQFFGPETTLKELRGLQSKLREEARAARSNDQFNRARIANGIADAITEDIGGMSGPADVAEQVQIALAFSRDLNDRFTRGAMGRLLGFTQEGAPSVPAGLTLESTVGRGGPAARESTDALLESVRRHGDEPAMRGYITDFLVDDFRRAAIKDGQFDAKAADRYISRHQDVLARFPEIRREMEQAKGLGQDFAQAQRHADPTESAAAVYLGAPPGREIEAVLNRSQPAEAMRDILSLAAQDSSGKAVRGVKQSFMNRLLRQSEIALEDAKDQPFVSGQKLTRAIQDDRVQEAMGALFSEPERARIDAVVRTANLLDRQRNARPSVEGVLGDVPGQVTNALGRILGAQIGRQIAQQTGGGTVQTPGVVAGLVQRMMKAGINDPGRRLVNDAIQDEGLMRALLLEAQTDSQKQYVAKKLNGWMLTVLHDYSAENYNGG
jgi:hypothetical protein